MKALLLAFIFVISLVGTATFISRLLPPLEVPLVDEKLAFFADHRDEFDTLFFGSSRTYAQIFPESFDAKTAEAGFPTTSFNFGIDGLFPPEDGYVAERLFALRPKNLRRVFIEVSFFREHWFAMDPDSVRALYWQDARSLKLAVQQAVTGYNFMPVISKTRPRRWKDWQRNFPRWWADLSPGKALDKRLQNVAIQTRLFLRRACNAGRGSDLVARLGRGTVRKYNWSVLGEDWRGMRRPVSRKRIPEPPLEQFDRWLADAAAKPIALTPMSPAHGEDVRRIVELVRAAGAEPILVVAPDAYPCRQFLRDEPDLPLFDFSEVAKWPQLYRREDRLDASHLDYDGAKVFTDEFARMFIAHEQAKIRR
ncbi:MAG: hypothetical protein ABIZ56_09525 [Chthoniobacteraceae bacterium]